jgi:neurofibromin 1
MPDVALEAMEALLVLHQPEKIEMWNPEAPINTFWDVSSQVRKFRVNIYNFVFDCSG